jgi:hypothetical protein
MIDKAGRASTGRLRPHSTTTSGLLIVAVSVLVFIPACSSSTPATTSTSTSGSTPSASATSTTSSVTLPEQNPAELAACNADAQSVQTALATYMAGKDAYPSPAASWSAATYAANYSPLTGASEGGPFLQRAPGTKYYVIEYDSAGQVWVAPPGSYGSYNKGQDFALQPNICEAAVD